MRKTRSYNISEAKARLPELVQRASRGEEITIARNGEPQALLVALPPRKTRFPGKGAGKWKLAPNFNGPLPLDLQDAFEGRTK